MRGASVAFTLSLASCSPTSSFYLTCSDDEGRLRQTLLVDESLLMIYEQVEDGTFVPVCDDCDMMVSPTTLKWTQPVSDGLRTDIIDRNTGRMNTTFRSNTIPISPPGLLQIDPNFFPGISRTCLRSDSPPTPSI